MQNRETLCKIGVIMGHGFQQPEDNQMKRLLQSTLAMIVLGLSGCADGRYPISGERCTPEDPVRTLEANDYRVVPTF